MEYHVEEWSTGLIEGAGDFFEDTFGGDWDMWRFKEKSKAGQHEYDGFMSSEQEWYDAMSQYDTLLSWEGVSSYDALWEMCPAELSTPIEQIRWPNNGIPSIPGIYTITVTYYR